MGRKQVADAWRIPDELWEQIEPLLPRVRRSKKGGRPPVPVRKVMDGIFYVLRTGCQWKAVPAEFGSGSTLHRRFQAWVGRGVFRKLWQAGLLEYDELQGIQWDWQSIDGAITKAPLGRGRVVPCAHSSISSASFVQSGSRLAVTRPLAAGDPPSKTKPCGYRSRAISAETSAYRSSTSAI